jgi:C4-dicarboxylate-specific signal transduction histidine kinase
LRWSIGAKLALVFLALAIVPMSVTAYYNLTQGQNAVAAVTRENLVELSRSTAHHIGLLLTENQRASAALAGQPSVISFLTASGDEREALSLRAYQTLQNFADTHPDYDAPGLLDVNGIVVASLADTLVGKDRSFRDYFQASIQGQPYVSSMLVGRATGRPGVFLTNPVVTAEGEIVGIDIVWLKADTIWSIIDDVVVGEQGIAYLVDQDGVIIAHPNRDLLYHSLGELTPEAAVTISATIRFGTAEGTDTPLIPESLDLDDLATELAPPLSPPRSQGGSLAPIATIPPLTTVTTSSGIHGWRTTPGRWWWTCPRPSSWPRCSSWRRWPGAA